MRLTPLSKALIVFVVLGAIAAGIYVNRGALQKSLENEKVGPGPEAAPKTPGGSSVPVEQRPRVAMVLGVNDFGGAYPALVANDGIKAGPNSLFAKAGIDLEVRLVRGSKERLAEFDAGKIDIMLLTLDYVANLYADYHEKGQEVQTFLFVDWSRGNLGIVARPGIRAIEDLKKTRIATTRNTPSHYFLLTLLDRSNLKPDDLAGIKSGMVFAKKTPLAGEMFQRGEVDAVAIWEPHLSQAMEKTKGKLLVSTKTATNLIADVLFARTQFLDKNAEVMPRFLEAWFEGVARIKSDKEGSVAVIAKAFDQSVDETRGILDKIKLGTFADNRAFFGLETEDSPSQALLREAAEIWKREGVIKTVPDVKKIVRTRFLDAISAQHRDERVVEDFRFTPAKADATALLSKSISIYFDSGSATLDAKARSVVDGFGAQVIGVFQNAYVRVEGNTDAQGSRKVNKDLSERRAQAVVDYLVSRHHFDRARFVAVGNGSERPVADNRSAEGREFNRRTDFRIVPNY